MPLFICLLRGVNVGGNKKLKMSDLKAICESFGCTNVRTHLQSGNVVVNAKSDPTKRLEAALAAAGVESKVVVRTPDELRAVIAANPFPKQATDDPGHLLVAFLTGPVKKEAQTAFLALAKGEQVHFGDGGGTPPGQPPGRRRSGTPASSPAPREIYIYFPNGAGTSKLAAALTEKKLGVVPTARNWNTVTALAAMAEG